MTGTSRCTGLLLALGFSLSTSLWAEPVPLVKAVQLALTHSTTMAAAGQDEQRAYAGYRELKDQYIPQLTVGSGLGKAYGYPLSLEGSAPSIVNFTGQSPAVNFSLREFVRAAQADWSATKVQTKDQRNQTIQDTVLAYTALNRWQQSLGHLESEQVEAAKLEQVVEQRVQAGVDNPLERNRAKLTSARIRLHISQAQGEIDVLRSRLSHLTGLPANSIQTVPESIPSLPEVRQEDDLASKAAVSSPAVQVAEIRATAQMFRAKAEHKALWPSADFAAQYALLSTAISDYQQFFQPGSFQRHNATIGVVLRFPFFNASQRAKADGADADAVRAKRDAERARNEVSEQTLRLQRSVEQLAAAQQVADLEYQIAQSNLQALQVRLDAGSASFHDVEDAREQAGERFISLGDTNYELEKAQITLLRATGELENWVGLPR
ncbi:MAG TPA: TolC family protein [Terriglobales bacterium]|nr:TolC family protein [Terriglobales bacterium]